MDRRNFLQIVAAGVLGGSVNVGRGLSAVSSWTALGSNSIFAQARGSDKAELKIRKVDPVVLRLPARNEDLSLYPQDYLMVRIETEEGIVGWGEGTNWPKVATVATEIEMDKDAVVGASAWDIEKIWNTIYRNRNEMHGSHVQSAMSAIDIALWDIVGQQLAFRFTNCWEAGSTIKSESIPAIAGATSRAPRRLMQSEPGNSSRKAPQRVNSIHFLSLIPTTSI